MRIRRCTNLWLEPREVSQFRLDDLLAGGTGVVEGIQWYAHAAHLPLPVAVNPDEVAMLGEVLPAQWIAAASLRERHGAACVRRLLRAGLLIGSTTAWTQQRDADDALQRMHWHGLAAIGHAASRWHGVDAAGTSEAGGLDTTQGLRDALGPPPPTSHERGDPAATLALPRSTRTPFDDVLDARATCRNFDTDAELPLQQLARLLERVFGARGQVQGAADFDVLKKTSPSGGALHPTECYLIARRVTGLPRGLYHYRPVEHALRPLPLEAHALQADTACHAAAQGLDPIDALARIAVGGQAWCSDAHALCVLAPRFERNFWKYRDHPKAYRVCVLDVGHLSQTFQLCATEDGLGSYVTAAINEVDIERAFGLSHWREGPLAVCGVGPRAATLRTGELDPNHAVWPRA